MEGRPEVLVEDVIDDWIDERSAVGEPLESDDHLRRQVRLAGDARALDDVDSEERQVADDEDDEQDTEHLDGLSALVGTGDPTDCGAFPPQ